MRRSAVAPPAADLAGSLPGEQPEPAADWFDRLPDSVLFLIFGRIGDVKALGRCCAVSRRFLSLARQVEDALVRVDCVCSGDGVRNSSDDCSPVASSGKPWGLLADLLRLVLRPLQAITSRVFPGRSAGRRPGGEEDEDEDGASPSSAAPPTATRHSPAEVLRNFSSLRRLRIELPAGELSLNEGELVKWRADFGATLNKCVILGAASVLSSPAASTPPAAADKDGEEREGLRREAAEERIPGSLFSDGRLKRGVAWTISSLIAASARHYLLYPIAAEHENLESLELADGDLQGRLRMDHRQVEELREQPVAAAGSGSSQRSLVPALKLMLSFAPHLELPGGTVLKGATLVAVRPSEGAVAGAGEDDCWLSTAFEEPYATAAQQLLRRKMYCLEMNSF